MAAPQKKKTSKTSKKTTTVKKVNTVSPATEKPVKKENFSGATIYCSNCGKKIPEKAVICVHCGCKTQSYDQTQKSFFSTLLLCFFLGVFGAHRFYTGHTTSAVIMLILTLSFFGLLITSLWSFIDFIVILCGGFKTADGQKLTY